MALDLAADLTSFPTLIVLTPKVVRFAADASPTPLELELLELAVAAVDLAAKSIWPAAQAMLFGSQVW